MTPAFVRGAGPSIALVIAVVCAVLPAFPLGPVAASPPLPLAALWLAYGWAAAGDPGAVRPATLFGIGLLQDQLAGGPLGLMAMLFLLAYVFGGLAARLTRSYSLLTEWGGFAATVLAAGAVTVAVGALALPVIGLGALTLSAGLTILAFPFARPLYLSRPAQAGGSA